MTTTTTAPLTDDSLLAYDIGWRLKALSHDKRDPVIRLYHKYQAKQQPAYVGAALFIYQHATCRTSIETMLLADVPVADIAKYFGVSETAVDYYAQLCYDVVPVRASKMKLLLIAQHSLPSDIALKTCAVKFGASFIAWYYGITPTLPADYSQGIEQRLQDGLLLKTLGHEFVNADSAQMQQYLNIFKVFKNRKAAESAATAAATSSSQELQSLLDHFGKSFAMSPNQSLPLVGATATPSSPALMPVAPTPPMEGTPSERL